MQKHDITSITGKSLPEELNRLYKPPASLRLLGDPGNLVRNPKVGIVGARKFTPYGKEVTSDIAATLARAGVIIVSGLALGIDSIAHRSALESGGRTIAVLPSGLQNIYPATHQNLARQIVGSNGLLVSEYPDSYRPMKVSFLERNRIIAALSDVLIVTEAAEASGSLNTASHALELGIPVMAVPGNINSPNSKGTNNLIKAGAIPLTSPEDVIQLLGIESAEKNDYLPETSEEAVLLECIRSGTSKTNDLIEASNLDTSTAQTLLTILEIKGIISVEAGNWRIL